MIESFVSNGQGYRLNAGRWVCGHPAPCFFLLLNIILMGQPFSNDEDRMVEYDDHRPSIEVDTVGEFLRVIKCEIVAKSERISFSSTSRLRCFF